MGELPREILSVHVTGQSPDIVSDNNGSISLAYAVPINDDRGIYLTKSTDGGDSWSESIQVFDGVATQWEIVDKPKITFGGNGNYHLLWERATLQGSNTVSDLYYARSTDNGITWSEPEIVTQEQVLQSDIIGLDDKMIHRAWIIDQSNQNSLVHQYSLDGGITWSNETILTGFDETVEAFSLIGDVNNSLHLTIISTKGSTPPTLQHLKWVNGAWETEEVLNQIGTEIAPNSLDTAINNLGRLVAIYTELALNEESDELSQFILFTTRLITIEQQVPTPIPTQTPDLTIEPNLTPTTQEIIQPTPIPSQSTTDLTSQKNGNNIVTSSFGGLIIGIVLAGILVALIFGLIFGIRFFKNR